MLTFEQIKELMEIAGRERLQRVEIERSGFRLRIDGQGAVQSAPEARPVAAVPMAPVASLAALAAGTAAASPASASAPAAEAPASEPEPQGHVLQSPIVGTFYNAPSPDADPFAKVGDRVKVGQVLCIVEAMKLMNEIESDVNGTVREIFPKNAQPVEFGEPLFAIDPE